MLFKLTCFFPRFTGAGFQTRVQFDAACLIDGKERTTLRLNASIEHAEDTLLGFEFGGEELVELLGAPHLDGFENHHRPRDDGEAHQDDDDDLRLHGCDAPNVREF
jgi:hypothetical protein